MRDAVIVDAVRTPVGKRNGMLSSVHPTDLSAHVLKALASRTNLDPALVDDIVWGCVSQVGEQTGCIGRFAGLAAGWPEEVPGVTIDRQCGSSQQSVHFAAAGVVAGHYDIVVAGGVESMSRVPMGTSFVEGKAGFPFGPLVMERYNNVRFNQGVGAEMIAEEYGLSRTALDEGRFAAQIAPLGEATTDEGVRRGSTLEQLGGLKPAFKPDGVIHAGNS